MLPTLRKRLRGISSKNKSLQDILRTSKEAKEVLSILPTTGGIHNTQLVLLVDQGENVDPKDRFIRRIHFYSRLDLADIMSGVTIESKDLPSIINELNLKGYDFDEHDLELVNKKITAKSTSLGYIGFYDQLIDSSNFPVIECAGAMPAATPVYASGTFQLIIDGVLIGTGTVEELTPLALQHGLQILPAVKSSIDLL